MRGSKATSLKVLSLATLGDGANSFTCSMVEARQSFSDALVVPVPTYEDGAELVVEGKAEGLLVAAAYPKIGQFFMDHRLEAVIAYLRPIPDLVVAAATPNPNFADELYYYPAMEWLLDSVSLPYKTATPAANNEDAADRMQKQPNDSAAITNGVVAKERNLFVVQTLRPTRAMGWFVFVAFEGEPRCL